VNWARESRGVLLASSLMIGQLMGPSRAAWIEGEALAIKGPAAIELVSCALPGVARARCGVFNVPENPDRPAGRQLAIHVAVVPAVEGSALPDPIVPLMGGPGEDAISAAALYSKQFAPVRAHRDLLLVDQRGTGASAALHCDLFSSEQPPAGLRDVFPPAAVAACEGQLAERADLRQYGYLRFSSDLEQIRRALGYGSLNLFAGSYGTRAAVVFIRAYPNSVRTVYLGSVVPIDVAQPLPMARTAQMALESTFAACAADPACRRSFPNLRGEFREVVARLDIGVRVSIPGSIESAVLARGRRLPREQTGCPRAVVSL